MDFKYFCSVFNLNTALIENVLNEKCKCKIKTFNKYKYKY